MTMKTTYLIFEGLPAILFENKDEMVAILWNGEEWVEMHQADAFVNGGILSKSEFDARFGHLPSPEILPA